ncbi:hypothetical protein MTO96_001254 [Rhipicephalus appendiculatus]
MSLVNDCITRAQYGRAKPNTPRRTRKAPFGCDGVTSQRMLTGPQASCNVYTHFLNPLLDKKKNPRRRRRISKRRSLKLFLTAIAGSLAHPSVSRHRCSWAPFVDSLPATPPPLQLAAIITASSVNGRRRHSKKGKRRQRDIVRKTPGHALKPDLDIWFSGAGGDWGDGEGEIYTALKTLRVRH